MAFQPHSALTNGCQSLVLGEIRLLRIGLVGGQSSIGHEIELLLFFCARCVCVCVCVCVRVCSFSLSTVCSPRSCFRVTHVGMTLSTCWALPPSRATSLQSCDLHLCSPSIFTLVIFQSVPSSCHNWKAESFHVMCYAAWSVAAKSAPMNLGSGAEKWAAGSLCCSPLGQIDTDSQQACIVIDVHVCYAVSCRRSKHVVNG